MSFEIHLKWRITLRIELSQNREGLLKGVESAVGGVAWAGSQSR